jgi:two-component system NarL family sensor kinase
MTRRLPRIPRLDWRHRFRDRLLLAMLVVSLGPLAIFAGVVVADLGSISRSTVDEANRSIFADQVDSHQHQLGSAAVQFQEKIGGVENQLRALRDRAGETLGKPQPPFPRPFSDFGRLHVLRPEGTDYTVVAAKPALRPAFDPARAAADAGATITLVDGLDKVLTADPSILRIWIADTDDAVVTTIPVLVDDRLRALDAEQLLNGDAGVFSATARDLTATPGSAPSWSEQERPGGGGALQVRWTDVYPTWKPGEVAVTAWLVVTASGHHYKLGFDIGVRQLVSGLVDNSLSGYTNGYGLLLSSGNRLLGLAGDLGAKDFGLARDWIGTSLPLTGDRGLRDGLLGIEQTGRATALAATLGDTEREFFTAAIVPTGWVLVTSVPKATLLPSAAEQPGLSRGIETGVRRILVHVIPVAVLLCALAFILATLMARRLVGPVGALTVAAERLADHPEEAVPPQGDDEVGLLATSLERMRGEVNASRDAILAAARELEGRVADRTTELRARNEELVALNNLAGSLTRSLDRGTLVADALEALRAMVPVLAGRGYGVTDGQPTLLSQWSESGAPAVADELTAAATLAIATRGLAMRPGPRGGTLVGLPLGAGAAPLGVLAVLIAPGWQLGGRTRALLGAVADQVGLALRTAQLSAEGRELAVLEERTRLAREIHDTLAQQLTAIVLQLEAAEAFVGRDRDRDRARAVVVAARDLARSALHEARRSVWNLRPAPLEATGLVAAIQLEADRWEARSGIRARVRSHGLPVPLSLAPQAEVALFRIVQEALSNVARHSGASRVDISIELDDTGLGLVIGDDGAGLDASRRENPGSFGLVSMAERARLVGGTLEIRSAPGAGTRLHVRVPLGENVDAGGDATQVPA